MTAAAAHLPVTPQHLQDAPYMGVLFVVFALAALAAAAGVLLADTAVRYALLAALGAAAVLTYATTRLVALPRLADDVGRWLDPLGVLSLAAELLAVAAALAALRGRRRPFAPHLEQAQVRAGSR